MSTTIPLFDKPLHNRIFFILASLLAYSFCTLFSLVAYSKDPKNYSYLNIPGKAQDVVMWHEVKELEENNLTHKKFFTGQFRYHNTLVVSHNLLFTSSITSSTNKASSKADGPLKVLSFSPADNAVNIPKTTNQLIITFDRPVKEKQIRGGGDKLVNIRLNRTANSSLEVINANSPRVRVDGNRAIIDLTTALPAGAYISVHIPSGIFADADSEDNDNEFEGIAENDYETWNFTTAADDTTPPTITSVVPETGTTNIALAPKLVINFSESIIKGQGTITIYRGTNVHQTINVGDNNAVQISADGKTVTLTPNELPGQTTFYVLIQAGAFKDLANNNFAGITSPDYWTFTTKDVQAPTITGFVPANGTPEVEPETPLEITFSETVRRGTGRIVITYGTQPDGQIIENDRITINGNIVRILPDALPDGTQITVLIEDGAFTDEAGNLYTRNPNDTWSFRTQDQTPPQITAYSPAANETGVAEDASLQLTFDEPVKASDQLIQLFNGPTLLESFKANETNKVTITDKQVSIKPSNVFPSEAKIHILIEPGAFTDQASNAFAGIVDEKTWSFTIKDTKTPTATTVSPQDGSTDIPIDTDLTLTFDEAVEKGTGTITITAGTDVQTFDMMDAAVSINATVVTINPADLPYSSLVVVQISAGAFQDAAGNAYAGITDNTSWNFTTVPQPDNTPPTVSSFSPAKGETNVVIDQNLILTFNEPIQKGLIGSITLYQNNTILQSIDITNSALTISNKVLTINPPQDLPEGATVSVRITQGAITDLAGNVYAGISDNTTWQFTTLPPADEQAPVVAALSPANNAAEVAVNENLLITFDEPVQAVETKKIFIYQNNILLEEILATSNQTTITGNQVSINPSDDFAEGATIYLFIEQGAFQDLADNDFAGISSANGWKFETVAPQDKTAPRITAYSPDDGDTDIAIEADLIITFDEAVEKGTGSITITAGTQVQTIDVADAAVLVDGTTVTINPADLPYESPVFVRIPAGAFHDAADNAFGGILDNSTWNFTTAAQPDTQAPTVNTYSPATGETEVALDADFILTFNEPVKKGTTGSITIYQGNTLIQTINITDASVSVQDHVLTIDPAEDLPEGVTLSVQITAGAITDLADNPYVGITDNTTWNFTTVPPADKQAPVIAILSPATTSTDVATDANLMITFDEAIQATNKKIIIYQDNAVLEEIFANSNKVTISEKQVTINPDNAFPEGTTLHVLIEAGAFQDLSDNDFAGINIDTGWRFSTVEPKDLEAPVIETYSPTANATEVDIASTLSLTFSEPVQKGTTGNVTIYQETRVVETIELAALSISGNVVTIDPLQDLPEGVTLYVQITPGIVTDLAGNSFAGITNTTTWTFTTKAPADQTAPLVLTLSPANNATNVAVDANLVLTFDEVVLPVENKTIAIYQNNSLLENVSTNQVTIVDNQVTINPSADFLPGAAVYVLIEQGAFRDASNNAYAGILTNNTWNFTTTPPVDNIAPTIAVLSPADEATGVAIDATLVINFDEAVQAIADKKIYIYQNGTLLEDLLTTQVSVAANQVTIDPVTAFTLGASIYVLIEPGAFTDLAGNAYAGTTDNTTWNFTVAQPEDTTPPTVTTLSPADEASGVAIDANLALTFVEAVEKGAGTITITAGTQVQTINVTDAAVSVDGTIVTINPADLPYNSSVVVQLSAGAFVDAAGNAYAGITDNTSWNFTTVGEDDTTPPTVSVYSPANNATEVATNSNLVITFDEPVQKGTTGEIAIYQANTLLQTITITDANVTLTDNVLTIDPAQDLPAGVNLHVRITAGAITDLAGNAFAGITDNTSWQFTTQPEQPVDQIAPLVLTLSPANNATGVALDQNLVITFDEPVKKAATGSLTIYQGNTLVQTIAITNASVTVQDEVLTINPPQNLPEGATLSIQISAGAVTDLADNPYAGIADNTTWTFRTADPEDTEEPFILTYSPAQNAIDVDPTQNLVLTFNEPVIKGEGNITLLQGLSSQQINVNSSQVNISSNTVSINPDLDLPSAASVSVRIEKGAFQDNAGNQYEGIATDDVWTFQTKDVTPLLATSYTPNNIAEVPVDTNLEIVFNKDVIRGAGTITIYAGSAIQTIDVTSTQQVGISGNKVTINPENTLPAATPVYIQITEGAFTDASANSFAGIADNTTWAFTTAQPVDETAPIVNSLVPADEATGIAVDANLLLTFNEPVIKGEGNITLLYNNQNRTVAIASNLVTISANTVTIDPPADLPFATLITVLVPQAGFKDIAGNDFVGITDPSIWNFTTAQEPDIIPPTITTLNPARNAQNVPTGSKLELIFNEPVEKGNGTIAISQNNSTQLIDVNSEAVAIEESKAIITPDQPLVSKATVRINIERGTFTDLSGNPFEGFEEATAWTFNVEDETGPLVTALSPSDDANDVPVDANLEITFDDEVETGQGQITINTNGKEKKVAVNSNAVTINSNRAIIDPNQTFPTGATVSVQIDAGTFVNKLGKPYQGLTDPAAWNFRTLGVADEEAPTVSMYSPIPGSTNVEKNTNLVLTFTEPVVAAEGNIILTQGTTIRTIPILDPQVTIIDNILTINPSTDFEEGVSVSIQITAGAVTDLSANDFAGITDNTTWSFTIRETVPPVVSSLSPADEATGVAIDATLVINFDEAVQAIADKKIYIYQNGTLLEDLLTTQVSVAANQVTIDPVTAFTLGASIYVLIEPGAFTDLAGNAYAGITDNTSWNFTVAQPEDTTPPTVTALSPTDEATEVAIDANLVLTFDEAVEKGAGTITITAGTQVQTINIADAAVSVDGTIVTINPA
ncbi:Ig-like domain-containing protein, partial [Rhodocytophaga aerolata]